MKFNETEAADCSIEATQNPSTSIVMRDSLVNRDSSDVNGNLDNNRDIAAARSEEYSTPAKESTAHSQVNINEYEKEQEQSPQKVNTAPLNSSAHLVMEILDEVFSTPCPTATKDSMDDEEVIESKDKEETMEDIQAFVDKPVSIANKPIATSHLKENNFTPEKDDKQVDHSKVVRKLNMDSKNFKAAEPGMGNHSSQVSMQKKKQGKARMKRMSRSMRSGLVFPVSRVAGQLKKGKYAKHIQVTASVYLTAVLEYLVAEVLELSGNCAKYYNKRRVFPRCILLTLRHDTELDQLTKGAIVPQGGVKPFIHRELLPVEKRVSHFHPKYGGFLSAQDMLKYNLMPSLSEKESPVPILSPRT